MNIQSTLRKQAAPVQGTVSQKADEPSDGASTDVPPSNPARDFFETTMDSLKTGGMFALEEVRELGKNDPALGLRVAANGFDTILLDGTGEINQGFAPMGVAFVRGGLLGANVFRASQTLKDPSAQTWEKALDIGRVATDAVGLVGSVMRLAFPSQAALGLTLTQFSYGADLLSHSVRTLDHGNNRYLALQAKFKAKEDA